MCIGSLDSAWSQQPAGPPPQLVEALRHRVARNPYDASSWRLLGQSLEQLGDLAGALQAFEHAARINPDSAAAHCGLGRVLATGGDLPRAVFHWQRTIELAPGTEYAQEAATRLAQAREVDDRITAQLTNFQVDWLDSPEPPLGELDQPITTPSPWRVRLESGLLYNSNVQLAPISRELAAADQSSFQAYFAPDVEYRFLQTDAWQWGSLLRGYYNLNERGLRQFNLEHQEGGLFVEHLAVREQFDVLSRMEYGFTYDLFNGRTFGVRHALNGSLSAQLPDGRTWTLYATVDYTDFREDGIDPSLTSLDGSSQTLGLSHTVCLNGPLSLVRFGGDVQNAALEGSSYAFRGLMLYADAEIICPLGCLLVLQAAQGYRAYPEYEFTPGRDEWVSRAAAELRKPITPNWSISGNFVYDRFASGNDQFDASRYTSGMFVTFLH